MAPTPPSYHHSSCHLRLILDRCLTARVRNERLAVDTRSVYISLFSLSGSVCPFPPNTPQTTILATMPSRTFSITTSPLPKLKQYFRQGPPQIPVVGSQTPCYIEALPSHVVHEIGVQCESLYDVLNLSLCVSLFILLSFLVLVDRHLESYPVFSNAVASSAISVFKCGPQNEQAMQIDTGLPFQTPGNSSICPSPRCIPQQAGMDNARRGNSRRSRG